MTKIDSWTGLLVWVENNMTMAQTVCLIASAACAILMDLFTIINKETSSVLHNMYEIIPESIGLKYYSTETRGRNIRVDGHIKLVEIDLKKLTAKGYAKIRRNLAKYMIAVYYQGVYDQGSCRQITKDLSELFGHTYRDPYKKRGILSSQIKLPGV